MGEKITRKASEKGKTLRKRAVCWIPPVHPFDPTCPHLHPALCWEADLHAPHPLRLPVLWLLVGVDLGEPWREGEYKEGGEGSQSIFLRTSSPVAGLVLY